MSALLSVAKVAERLGVCSNTVYALCRDRKIEYLRVGGPRGVVRISEEAFEAYLRSVTVSPHGERPKVPDLRREPVFYGPLKRRPRGAVRP